MKIGVTGHQELADHDWVNQEIHQFLRKQTPLIAYSSLAVGADQIFAQVVIDCGGELNVILPMKEYEEKFDARERSQYKRLLSQATSVDVLPGAESDEDAYLFAGEQIVERCELLIAVWDGQPAKGKGGTGDIVDFASRQGRAVFHINPIDRTVGPYPHESFHLT